MINYRRNRISGGTCFFTVTLRDRRSNLLIKYIDLLKESFRYLQLEKPYKTKTIVILPDHIHAIWELPMFDSDYSRRWQKIKGRFTQKLVSEGVNLAKDTRGEYILWQRRFWEHTIKNEDDLEKHIDYVHYNPVKHKLVERVSDWPYSSFHEYVVKSILPEDWGSHEKRVIEGDFGE